MKSFALAGCILVSQAFAVCASSIYDVSLKDIEGKETSLSPYKGKVLLIVNVASKCGLTPQYAALESIHEKYKDKGFMVLAFPCNQFGGQEPGTNQEIKQFCSSNYHVSFPMFDKIDVNGQNRHPLFVLLAGDKSPYPGDIKWNFNKFLVGRNGTILKRFEPKVAPDDSQVTDSIEAALKSR